MNEQVVHVEVLNFVSAMLKDAFSRFCDGREVGVVEMEAPPQGALSKDTGRSSEAEIGGVARKDGTGGSEEEEEVCQALGLLRLMRCVLLCSVSDCVLTPGEICYWMLFCCFVVVVVIVT